jgi:transposase
MSNLSKICLNSAGIDIGSEKVFVAIEDQPVKNFRTFTAAYRELGLYLKEHKITHIAMEATGIYWITLYDILEEMGFDVTLVNPADSKNLPGRKTDVQDCQWIQQLFSYGLLKKSFVPQDIVRKLRVYTRMREDKLQMASSHIQHMQKALIQMNIRLPEVLSQTHGASGIAMIQQILAGERDAAKLLSYCTSSLKKRKGADILLALEGNYKEEYLFELQQAYDGYMFYLEQVRKCDTEAGKILQEFNNKAAKNYKDDSPIKPIRHNKPNINHLHELLLGIQGANPTVLPGVNDYSFMRLTAELGNDISQWPSEKNFVSWLGLAPGKNQSGKINKRSKKRAVTRAGQIFKQAAQSLLISKQPGLGAFARKIKARRGAAIAIKATARKLAGLYYKIFSHGLQYVEQGVKMYEEKVKQQQIQFIIRKANELNLQIIDNHSHA